MIQGIDKFKEYFADLVEDYAIIGGTAASMLMNNAGSQFRLTKDIDLVIIALDTKKIAKKISEFVAEAEYEISEKGDGQPIFYRFRKPRTKEYPEQLEIFHKSPDEILLREGQHITPIISDDGSGKLTAILLENEYFNIIKENCTKLNGITVPTTEVIILLKARAYNDLSERKNAGEPIDSKEIKKHRNDIFRLVQILDSEGKLNLDSLVAKHLSTLISAIGQNPAEMNGILNQLNIKMTSEEIISILQSKFSI